MKDKRNAQKLVNILLPAHKTASVKLLVCNFYTEKKQNRATLSSINYMQLKHDTCYKFYPTQIPTG